MPHPVISLVVVRRQLVRQRVFCVRQRRPRAAHRLVSVRLEALPVRLSFGLADCRRRRVGTTDRALRAYRPDQCNPTFTPAYKPQLCWLLSCDHWLTDAEVQLQCSLRSQNMPPVYAAVHPVIAGTQDGLVHDAGILDRQH